MISGKDLYQKLADHEVWFYSGVPDSLLKEFCWHLTKNLHPQNHIIAANEGNAIAIAAGYHLSTGKIPLVYMQNSGLGNAVNPLTSLTNKEVYSIPILLFIGWRGEPQIEDEPQHRKPGEITHLLLDALNIPYKILPNNLHEAEEIISHAIRYLKREMTPYALLVKKGTFESNPQSPLTGEPSDISREEAIRNIVQSLGDKDIIVSTTGKTSRELFEIKETLALNHSTDFLTVGSMGHCSQIALGIALSQPKKNIYCLDGDGAMLMHMGSLAVIGSFASENFRHILLNNGAHESVGGQPTVGMNIDFCGIAKSCRYKTVSLVHSQTDLGPQVQKFKFSEGPSFLEIRIRQGARSDLGRPTITPREQKYLFMKPLNEKID